MSIAEQGRSASIASKGSAHKDRGSRLVSAKSSDLAGRFHLWSGSIQVD